MTRGARASKASAVAGAIFAIAFGFAPPLLAQTDMTAPAGASMPKLDEGTVGSTIRADPSDTSAPPPQPAPAAAASDAGDDMSGDSITVTGGVPGSAAAPAAATADTGNASYVPPVPAMPETPPTPPAVASAPAPAPAAPSPEAPAPETASAAAPVAPAPGVAPTAPLFPTDTSPTSTAALPPTAVAPAEAASAPAEAAPAPAPPVVASAPAVVPGAPPPDAALAPQAEAPAAAATPSGVLASAPMPPAQVAPESAESLPPVEGTPAASSDTTTASAATLAPPMTFAPPPPTVPDNAPVPPPPDISASLPHEPTPEGEVLAAGKKSGKSPNDGSGTNVASNEQAQGGPFTGLQLNNSKSPIDINSESMSLDYKNHSVMWTGHVHANQANAQLTSDKLQVNYTDKDMKDMKDIVAMGNVRISQGTRWATGDHAVMDQKKRTAVLTGSPVVHDGQNQITGTRVTIYLDTGQSVVEHARAVIFPHDQDETPSPSPTAGQQ